MDRLRPCAGPTSPFRCGGRGRRGRAGRLPAALALTAALAAVGCTWVVRRATTPMPALALTAPGGAGATSVVFLPGRFDRPQRFAREGFAELLSARSPGAAAVAADAHLGYYLTGSLVERLQEDVLQPVQQRTGVGVHLVGISMGGLGALLYARAHPEEVAGVVVLAPYLGDEKLIAEIAAAGGLARWRPPARPDPDDFQRDIWSWLKGYAEPGTGRPPLVLAWGEDDDLAPASRLLAAALPGDRVFTAAGGHDWPTWRRLWAAILESDALEAMPEGAGDR